MTRRRRIARALGDRLRRTEPRELVGRVRAGFADNDLLTYASAISFRILFALPPFGLFALALLGFLQLGEVWARDVAPEVRAGLSPEAFAVVDETVRTVLESRQLFWLTAGAALALWEVSAAVRAVMGALDGVYGARDRRSPGRRLLTSITLGVAVSACLLGAAAAVRFGALLHGGGALADVALFAARWAVAVALLLAAVGLLVRFAPAVRRPLPWVTLGAGLVVVSWIAVSLAFGWYIADVAPYESVFGGLASLFVLMTYLYLSSIAFLAGVQVDALLREEYRAGVAAVDGEGMGGRGGGRPAERSTARTPPAAESPTGGR